MASDIHQILMTVASRVFETSAFMCVLSPEEVDLPPSASNLAASISFSGPLEGRLIFAVSPDILPLMVTSMLGLDEIEDIGEEAQRDALLEILNIICGNVLTEIHGDKPVFNLSPPQIVATEEMEVILMTVPPENHVTFALENTRADLILLMGNALTTEKIAEMAAFISDEKGNDSTT
ncbi:MAG: chemotaxis protein CheX [Calditrichaeota bacterium]|nr:chemotaxis protein CheX [Calditrichota bacterium]